MSVCQSLADFMPKQLHMSILDETFREPSQDDGDSDNESRCDVEVSSRPAAACTNKDPGKEKDATARIQTTEASSTDGDATAKAKKLKLPLHILSAIGPPETEFKTNSVRYPTYLEVNIIRAEHLPRMDITGHGKTCTRHMQRHTPAILLVLSELTQSLRLLDIVRLDVAKVVQYVFRREHIFLSL